MSQVLPRAVGSIAPPAPWHHADSGPRRVPQWLQWLGSGAAREVPAAMYDAETVTTQVNANLRKYDGVVKTDLPSFNKLVRDTMVPAVILKGAQ